MTGGRVLTGILCGDPSLWLMTQTVNERRIYLFTIYCTLWWNIYKILPSHHVESPGSTWRFPSGSGHVTPVSCPLKVVYSSHIHQVPCVLYHETTGVPKRDWTPSYMWCVLQRKYELNGIGIQPPRINLSTPPTYNGNWCVSSTV